MNNTDKIPYIQLDEATDHAGELSSTPMDVGGPRAESEEILLSATQYPKPVLSSASSSSSTPRTKSNYEPSHDRLKMSISTLVVHLLSVDETQGTTSSTIGSGTPGGSLGSQRGNSERGDRSTRRTRRNRDNSVHSNRSNSGNGINGKDKSGSRGSNSSIHVSGHRKSSQQDIENATNEPDSDRHHNDCKMTPDHMNRAHSGRSIDSVESPQVTDINTSDEDRAAASTDHLQPSNPLAKRRSTYRHSLQGDVRNYIMHAEVLESVWDEMEFKSIEESDDCGYDSSDDSDADDGETTEDNENNDSNSNDKEDTMLNMSSSQGTMPPRPLGMITRKLAARTDSVIRISDSLLDADTDSDSELDSESEADSPSADLKDVEGSDIVSSGKSSRTVDDDNTEDDVDDDDEDDDEALELLSRQRSGTRMVPYGSDKLLVRRSTAKKISEFTFDMQDFLATSVQERLHNLCAKGELLKLKEMLENEKNNGTPLDFDKQFLNTALNDCSLLHTAALHGRIEIMEYLFSEGASIDIRDVLDATPLYYSVTHGFAKASAFLCNHGSTVNMRDRFENTPFLLAMKSNHITVASTLLLFGCDINFKGKRGEAALHICARPPEFSTRFLTDEEALERAETALTNQIKQLRFLVDAGANPAITNRQNETPLFNAVSQPLVLHTLLDVMFEKYDASQATKWVLLRDTHGRNILHRCCERGFFKSLGIIVKKLQGNDRALRVLLNEKDKQHSKTPLQYAVQAKQEEIVRLLAMAKEVDINAQNSKGDTALHMALRQGDKYSKVAQLLYSPGMTNLHIKNNNGISVKALAKKFDVNLEDLTPAASSQSKSSKHRWKKLFGFKKKKKTKKNTHIRHGSTGITTSSDKDGKDDVMNKKQILDTPMETSWKSTRRIIELRTSELEKNVGTIKGDTQFIIWDDSFKWNVTPFDRSNEILAEIINSLYKVVMMTLVDPLSLLYILRSLREFTRLEEGIFVEEERLMLRYNMNTEEIRSHIEDHYTFRTRMKYFEDHTDTTHTGKGADPGKYIQMELLNFLMEHWQNHVLTKDKHIATWIQEKDQEQVSQSHKDRLANT